MIFGRSKGRRIAEETDAVDELATDEVADVTADDAEIDEADTDDAPVQAGDAVDPREDGPFDIDEVDLDGDDIERIAFGPLVITPFEGLNLQLHGDPEGGVIQALLAAYDNSGLELALFAAPRSGGLADELREAIVAESERAGGHAEEASGPFGPELRRVLPMEGPEGEQLFHVSRIWLVEGPRWLLRGTLMGEAGLVEGDLEPADLFAEFYRNVVVQRDEEPRVPGELIPLSLPEGAAQG